MKSAYVVLGVPGNATAEDLEIAYRVALAHFTKEKLAENPALLLRLAEVKDAYKVLCDPEMRKSHDRKLIASIPQPSVRPVFIAASESPPGSPLLKWLIIAVVAIFAIGTYYSSIQEQARKEKNTHELALKKLEAEEAARAAADKAAADYERLRANTVAENRERQLRAESLVAARQQQAGEDMRQVISANQARNEKSNAAAEERQRQYDERQRQLQSQQRVADDQRRIRNLCMLNYGRPNC